MAAIIRDDKQDNALVEIEAALATVKQLNLMLGDRNMAAVYQIAMVPEKGRGVKVDVVHPEKKIFFSLCAKYRARLVKEIRVKAEKFRISLDSKDLACMEEGEKVYIPFEEFYRDNPIDMNKVDLNSEEGIADFSRRQRQMSERLYGCNIDFIITNVIAVSPSDYSVSGSRRQAMEILEMRNYISANDGDPYNRIGDVREADIISVGSFGLFCNVAGVDVSIPLRDVTFQYVTNLNDLYKSGDKIEVDIMDISRRKDGHVELAVNAKAAELRSAKERQDCGILSAGTTTIGQITSIRRSMRDPNRIVINAYLPYFKMPAVVSSMNPNTLAAAPRAGDMLRLVVTGFSDSGFVRTNCRGFHNVVNLTNR